MSTSCILRHVTLLKHNVQWDQRLLTFDPVALNHVTKNYNIYEKPWQSRRYISSLIGHGLLSVEGAAHKRQRRVATPAFSIQNLRAFAPTVFERGFCLRDRWRGIISKTGGDEAVLDVFMWVSRATFDVIGAAGPCTAFIYRCFNANGTLGFDYKFNSVEDDTNELLRAYKEMFELAVSQNKDVVRQTLGIYFPIIDVLFVSEFYFTDCVPLSSKNSAGPGS